MINKFANILIFTLDLGITITEGKPGRGRGRRRMANEAFDNITIRCLLILATKET